MAYLGRCILCGASLMVLDRDDHREGGICETCGINARLRGVVLAAVRELCGYPNAPLRQKQLWILVVRDHLQPRIGSHKSASDRRNGQILDL